MDLAELREEVDRLLAAHDAEDSDIEATHGDEDRLMVAVLRAVVAGDENAPELAAEILRTAGREDVTRWYA